MRYLVALGALAVRRGSEGRERSDVSADASVAQTFTELAAGDWYERLLALPSVYGSGDGDQALRALTDSSRTIRHRAVRLVAAVGDEAQIGPAFQALTRQDDRRALARRLLRRGRREAITQALASLSARQVVGAPGAGTVPSEPHTAVAPEAPEVPDEGNGWRDLLPYGAPPADRVMTRLLTAATRDEWARWARRHPVALAEAVLRALPPTTVTPSAQGTLAVDETGAATTSPALGMDARLLWQAGALLIPLAEAAPDAAMRLLRQLPSPVALGQLPLVGLQRVADRRPNEVADLVLASVDPVRLRFEAVVAQLTPERVLALLALLALLARGALGRPETWLGRLPVANRLRVALAQPQHPTLPGRFAWAAGQRGRGGGPGTAGRGTWRLRS